jgi:hypothetical protein
MRKLKQAFGTFLIMMSMLISLALLTSTVLTPMVLLASDKIDGFIFIVLTMVGFFILAVVSTLTKNFSFIGSIIERIGEKFEVE